MENLNNEQESVNPNDQCRAMDRALQYGTLEDLKSLFDSGMSIDQEDFEGRTALQMMSFRGKKEAIEMLLDQGADINRVFMYHGDIPKTALDAAKEAGRGEIVELLIAKGG